MPALNRRSKIRCVSPKLRAVASRDLELTVECAQRDVAGGDPCHERQHHAALRLLAGVDLRLRRFTEAPHAPEQVELPGCAERRLVQRKVVVDTVRNRRLADATRPHPTAVCAVADLRVQLRTRGLQCADELVDPRSGDAHVEVLAQCGIHQLVERRIAELLPPLRVRHVGSLRVVDAPRRRRIHIGAHVVGARQATGETDCREPQDRQCPHLDAFL